MVLSYVTTLLCRRFDYHVSLSFPFLSSHFLTFVRLVPAINTIGYTSQGHCPVPVTRCFFDPFLFFVRFTTKVFAEHI